MQHETVDQRSPGVQADHSQQQVGAPLMRLADGLCTTSRSG